MAGATTTRFCRNVRDLLRARGMTQRDLAISLGVTQASISQLLSGRHSPTLDKVEEVARAFGLDSQALVMSELVPRDLSPRELVFASRK